MVDRDRRIDHPWFRDCDTEEETELEAAFRFSLGLTRMDRIRNKYIRGTCMLDVL